MKKTLKNATLQVLIRPYNGKYIAMCLEMGLYFEGKTLENAQKQLFSAISLTLQAVQDDKSLAPSLFVGMGFGYTVFFYWSIFLYYLGKVMKNMEETFVLQGNATSVGGLATACG